MASLRLPSVQDVTALLIGRVGDLIVATPMLRALRERFPDARIKLVAGTAAREAAPLAAGIDDIRVLERFPKVLSQLGLARGLLAGRCDLLVDLNPAASRTSAALASLARSPIKLSFRKGRWDKAFNRHIEAPGEREHMLDRYARLAAELGAPYKPRLEVRLTEQHERQAEELMSGLHAKPGGLRVVIHPGNFKKFDNRWPEEKFVALTNLLLEDRSLHLFYMGGPGEEHQVKAIVSALKRPVPILPPASLGATGAMMKSMDLCVLNVTGTTHLAAALGVPTFCFYAGYTDAVWRPRGPEHSGVVSSSWTSCRDIPVADAHAALKIALARLSGAGPKRR